MTKPFRIYLIRAGFKPVTAACMTRAPIFFKSLYCEGEHEHMDY